METVPATTPPQVATIRFDSLAVNVKLGTDRQLNAIASDGAGNVLTGQDIRWNSINASIASVSASGVVHGVSLGTTVVTAVTGTHIASDTIKVVPAP